MGCKVVIRGQDERVPLSAIEVGGYFFHRNIAWQVLSNIDARGYVACILVADGSIDDIHQDAPVRRLRLVHAEFEVTQ